MIKNRLVVVCLKNEVEYLDYFIGFVEDDLDDAQIHVYKDAEFERKVAKASLILANRISTMFKNVGREERYLVRALTHFSSNL